MSEAEQPKALETVVESPATQPNAGAAQSPQGRSGGGVAWLALLLALGSAGALGWQYWQAQNNPAEAALEAQEQVLGQTVARLQREQQSWQSRLQALEGAQPEEQALQTLLSSVQGEQQRQAQQLARLQNERRNELRLAEAEHLLRLAALRLAALEDVSSAKALLAGADDLLREQNDPQAFAARAALAKAQEALQVRPAPDRTGLYLRLASLGEEMLKLTTEVPSFQPEAPVVLPEATEQGHWQRWWQQLSGYVRIEFNPEHDVRPLLTGQQLEQVRLALSLAVEQAQWAVLNGEQPVFEQALKQAERVLQDQFGATKPQVEALVGRLQALSEQNLSFSTPDLTSALEAFSAYLQQRQGARPSASEANQ